MPDVDDLVIRTVRDERRTLIVGKTLRTSMSAATRRIALNMPGLAERRSHFAHHCKKAGSPAKRVKFRMPRPVP